MEKLELKLNKKTIADLDNYKDKTKLVNLGSCCRPCD